MEEGVGPEPGQDPMDVASQETVSTVEEKEEPSHGDGEKVEEREKPTKAASEFKKTWGFRRTTIAKREMPSDPETPEGKSAPVRRSGRQAKRTDKLEEFLSTAKRGRGGRRSAPGHLENWDPPSQTPTDGETASEASFDGNAPADERKQSKASSRKKLAKGGSVSEDGSSENEDSPETMEKGQQKDKDGEGAEPQQPEQGSTEGIEEETNVELESSEKPAVEPSDHHAPESPAQVARKDSTPSKKDSKPKSRAKASKDDEDDSSSKSDNEGYDPNALYCICRQKHNKRFMICCDRCEEWFHGDCVGITEARGRLLERNGEDYICPNCTVHKSQAGSPADSSKRSSRRSQQSCAPEQTAPPGGAEEKANEDLGIKGRIEKATNPSGKKKIKIFQPTVEATSLPKCIGPGCDKNALPDSVYCGNDCILKHAAAAMKSITDVKEPKPKEKARPKAQKKPTTRGSAKKKPVSDRRTGARKSKDSSNKTDEAESDSEDNDEEDDGGGDDDDDDDDDDIGEEQRPSDHEPAISSWSSDHNYIAVTPDRAAAIASSVFNKSCMYLWEVCHTTSSHIPHNLVSLLDSQDII